MYGLSDVLRPAFDISLLPSTYDPSKPPTTGEEYIQRVVWEAANCEEVAVADLDRTQFNINQTPVFENIPGCEQAPAHLTPSRELQLKEVAKFSAVRRLLAKVKALESPLRNRVELPDKSYKQRWIKFCLGVTEQEFENDEKLLETDQGEPPLISTILSMNQPTVEQVLDYHVSLLPDRSCLTAQQGRWLYALLVALELPLTPDLCFLVRTLARECARIRAGMAKKIHEEAEVEKVAALNLFIGLVAHYFRQADLADS